MDIFPIILGLMLTITPNSIDMRVERPVFDDQVECRTALRLSHDMLKKYSLDPNRFECIKEQGKWIIIGKYKKE